MRGFKLAPPASPEIERIAVICTMTKLLNGNDQVRTIESLLAWYRQIEDSMLLKEDIVYLAMTGGESLLVQCQALQIDRAPLQHAP